MKTHVKIQGVTKLLDIAKLVPDPDQPRQEFDEVELKKLESSVADKGIMVPITVEPYDGGKFLIVDGERRFRVATRLKFREVPVNVLERKLSRTERNIIRFQLQETHTQWTVFEKAEAMNDLKNNLDLTIDELAAALSISVAHCHNYLAIIELSPNVRKRITKAKMPFSYITSLANLGRSLSDKMIQKHPDYVEKCVEKYEKGVVKNHKDFSMIAKLARVGETSAVSKFLNSVKYSANNAYVDTEYQTEQFVDSVANRAKLMIRDIQVIKRTKLKVDDLTHAVFDKLTDEIGKL